jgi:hypothetical protein
VLPVGRSDNFLFADNPLGIRKRYGLYRELAGLAKRSQTMVLPKGPFFLVYFLDRRGDFLEQSSRQHKLSSKPTAA